MQAEQRTPRCDWKQIGKALKFEMIAQPYFLQRQSADGKNRARDIEQDQLKSFLKVQIGHNPSINAMSKLLGRGDMYAQVMFASDDDDPPEVYCIPRLIDAARHLNNKSSPFRVIVSVDYSWDDIDYDYGNDESQILCWRSHQSISSNGCMSSSSSGSCRMIRKSLQNRFNMSLQLFLDPNEVIKYGGTLISDSGGIWGDESQVLCAFLGGHSMAASVASLGEHPMKSCVSHEERLLSSIPAVDAGSYSDTSCTLVRLLEGVVREIIRLGYRPLGFGLEDHLRRIPIPTMSSPVESSSTSSSSSSSRGGVVRRTFYSDDDESDEYNSGIRSISNLLYRNRLHIPTSIQCNRNYMLRNSLSALVTDLENLGHPLCSIAGTSKAAATVSGLSVSLRKYQQQTLAWAIHQETSEFGILGHITAPILDSSGRPTGIWFSPITGEFRNTPPKDVRGGFICDDVGMGKTVVALALILANPAPDVYSKTADEHWGQQRDVLPSPGASTQTGSAGSLPSERPSSASSALAPDVDNEDTPFPLQDRAFPTTAAASTNTTSDASARGDTSFCLISNQGGADVAAVATAASLPIIYSGATLVICPVSLVGQWYSETRDKLTRSDLVIIGYHGNDRERDICVLANSDIVITTYETVSADYRKNLKERSIKGYSSSASSSRSGGSSPTAPLASINWHRIILDESHKVKSQSVMNDAVSELVSKRRWCITGTPVHTKIADFAGQFRFLGVPIIGHMKYWYDMASKPHTKFNRDLLMAGVDPDIGFASVMALLRRTVIRHTKSMRYSVSDEPLLLLPSRCEVTCLIPLSAPEQETYLKLEKAMLKRYKLILRQGVQAIRRNTIQLLSLVKDLQMVCAGGLLSHTLGELLASATSDMDRNALFGECCICLDLMEEPLQTPCAHIFCADCIYGTINNLGEGRAPCPLCRRPLSSTQLKIPPTPTSTSTATTSESPAATTSESSGRPVECSLFGEEEEVDDDDYDPSEESRKRSRSGGGRTSSRMLPPTPGLKFDSNTSYSSTSSTPSSSPTTGFVTGATFMQSKLDWLVRKLRVIHCQDAHAKVLVFSQFSQTLLWLQEALPKKGFQFRTLSGSMSIQQRKKALEDFYKDPPTTLFLLSMRSGAVGVNLTQANHIIVMEPCLNRALEDQAIGRVHRIGQQRDVHIYRLGCRNTIEERILALQMLRGGNGTSTCSSNSRSSSQSTIENTSTSASGGGGGMGAGGGRAAGDLNSALLVSYGSQQLHASHANGGGRMLGSSSLSFWLDGGLDRFSSEYPHGSRFGMGGAGMSAATSLGGGGILASDRPEIGKRQYDLLFGLEPLPPAVVRTLEATCEVMADEEDEEEEEKDLSPYHVAQVDDTSSSSNGMEWQQQVGPDTSVADDSTKDNNTLLPLHTGARGSSTVPGSTSIGRKRTLRVTSLDLVGATTGNTATGGTSSSKRPKRSSAARGEALIRKFVLEEQRPDDFDGEETKAASS